MKRKYIFLIVIFWSAAHFCISQDKKTIGFIDNYISSAFWTTQGINQPLLKWADNVDTINYKLVGDLEYMSEKSLKKYLLLIESLTDKIFTSTENNDYHILIFFGDLKDYASLTGTKIPLNASNNFNNWSSRNWDKNYNLTKASYCIVPSKISDSNHGIYYLKRAVLKSLGILGAVNNEYSIFYKYPAASNSRLSREDKRFVKLHYNQAIKSGVDNRAIKEALLGFDNIEQLSKEKL